MHPTAEFLVHPECGCTSAVMHHVGTGKISSNSAQILSTNGMLDRARQSPAKEFVVATEIGIIHRLEQQNAALVAENYEMRRQLKELRLQLGREDMTIETGRRVAVPSDEA